MMTESRICAHMKGSNCECTRKIFSYTVCEIACEITEHSFCLQSMVLLLCIEENIKYNLFPNIIVEQNMQIRKFVLSVLMEGIEAGTKARSPGPKSGTSPCWHLICTKHANNKLKIRLYVANRVFSKMHRTILLNFRYLFNFSHVK